MSISTRLVFSIILGVIVAGTLTVGLDALSKPVQQLEAEKAMLSSPPQSAGRGPEAQDDLNVAQAPVVWQFLPSLLLALVVAFSAYTYSRVKLD